MWIERTSETLTRAQATHARRLSFGVIAALGALAALGAFWTHGADALIAPLRPTAATLSLTGIVQAAPRSEPLSGATVYSDKELCVTDARGFFRLRAGREALLRVEASGYESLALAVADERPLVLLLFPEVDKPAETSDN